MDASTSSLFSETALFPYMDEGRSNGEAPPEPDVVEEPPAHQSAPFPQPPYETEASSKPAATASSRLESPTQLYAPTQQELDRHPLTPKHAHIFGDHASRIHTYSAHHEIRPVEQPEQPKREQQSEVNTMADKEIKQGDEVSWQWSGSRPGGTVAEVVKEGEAAIESHRGNTIKKTAEPGNPAVHVERSGNDVVKKASELEIEEKGDEHKEAAEDKKAENGEASTGEKRKAEETAGEKTDEPADAKKQKTAAEPKENGAKGASKKKGRPAKAAKKETKKREPKKAATETGEPRRSGRNKA